MIHFVGAGPGAPDLITLRGKKLIDSADVIIYTGSLVNPVLLADVKETARIYDSSSMTLSEVIGVMEDAEKRLLTTVRLHTGDPSLYGAVREQMDLLRDRGIPYDSVPGVSSFLAAAAAMNLEYTLPGISQSLILTRMEGRTPVPETESIEKFAAHGTTMVIFLSTGLLGELSECLIRGGYPEDTPAAIVYKASWPDEKIIKTTINNLACAARAEGISRTALILVGKAIDQTGYSRSKLYDPSFETGMRAAKSTYKNAETDRKDECVD